MCVPGCEETVRLALSRRGFFRGASAAAAAASFAATAVTPEAAKAATFSRVVDLTHTMSAEFPTFFGGPGIEMQREKGCVSAELRLLIEVVARACKRISHAVSKGALGGVLGGAGTENIQVGSGGCL